MGCPQNGKGYVSYERNVLLCANLKVLTQTCLNKKKMELKFLICFFHLKRVCLHDSLYWYKKMLQSSPKSMLNVHLFGKCVTWQKGFKSNFPICLSWALGVCTQSSRKSSQKRSHHLSCDRQMHGHHKVEIGWDTFRKVTLISSSFSPSSYLAQTCFKKKQKWPLYFVAIGDFCKRSKCDTLACYFKENQQ